MNFTLEVWRQEAPDSDGRFESYQVSDIASEESFLEMIDALNDRLIVAGERPIAFDHDCREGICGACVAACPNGAAMLFTGAKVTHLGNLPQGQPGRYARVQDMVEQMDAEGFGGCTNFGECEAACPEEISIRVIGRLNRDFLIGSLYHPRNPRGGMKPQ